MAVSPDDVTGVGDAVVSAGQAIAATGAAMMGAPNPAGKAVGVELKGHNT